MPEESVATSNSVTAGIVQGLCDESTIASPRRALLICGFMSKNSPLIFYTVVSLAASLAFSPVAHAVEPKSIAKPGKLEAIPISAQSAISSAELAEMERELDLIFSVYLQEVGGTWVVNRNAASQAGVSVSHLETIAESMNLPPVSTSTARRVSSVSVNPDHRFGSEAWTRCVVNFTGFGSVYGFLDGSLKADIKAKRFKRPALAIIKIVGRSAVRGGVVGLVASLGAGATWCSTRWAS